MCSTGGPLSRNHSRLRRAADFYDEWTPEFLAECDDVFQSGLPLPRVAPETVGASMKFIAAEAQIGPGHHVLDAGCGVGGPARIIARSIPGVMVDGVTVSAVQVAAGNELNAEVGLADRVRLHLADYHALPFRDAAFDRVLLLEVTGYSPDLEGLYRELSRVLVPGGWLYVKDVFSAEGPLTPSEERDLEDFDRMWHVERSPTITESVTAIRAAGLAKVESGEYARVGIDRFLGAMFRLSGGSVELSTLGRGFLRTFESLPVEFGWIRARRP